MSQYEDEWDDAEGEIRDNVRSCLAMLVIFTIFAVCAALAQHYGWMELIK